MIKCTLTSFYPAVVPDTAQRKSIILTLDKFFHEKHSPIIITGYYPHYSDKIQWLSRIVGHQCKQPFRSGGNRFHSGFIPGYLL